MENLNKKIEEKREIEIRGFVRQILMSIKKENDRI